MGKVIDVTLKLVDQLSAPMSAVSTKLANNYKTMLRSGREISRMGKTLQSTGQNLTRSVTMPIVGIGAAAVKTASDFEQGMADVAAISKASSDEVEQLSEKAKSMDELGFAAAEVTDAYKYMGMAGWDASQMLAGVEPIMKLAAASGTELGATSDIVTDALTAFGAQAEDTARLTDILATAATSSNTDVLKLGETFKYVAPVAGAMNFSMEETSAIAGLMANAGIKASQAGTAMRSTFTNLAAPTKAAGIAMEKMGISATEMANLPVKEQMDKLREAFKGLSKEETMANAKAIAGKTGMSGLLAVINASEKDYNGLTSAIEGSKNATDEMFGTTMNTTQGQLKKLMASLKNLGTDFGQILIPQVMKVVEKLQGAVTWFKNLSESQKQTIVKVAGIAAAVGPGITILGKLTSGVGGAITTFGKLGKAISASGGLLKALMSPAGIVVGVLMAIAAAVAFVIKHWDQLKEPVMKCWKAIQPIVNSIKKAFSGLFSGIKSGGKSASDGLVGAFKVAFEFIAKILEKISPVIAKIIDVASAIVGKIAQVVGKIFEKIKQFYLDHQEEIDGILSFIMDGVGRAVETIGGYIEIVADTIGDVVSAVFDILGGVIDFVSGVFSGDWEKAWDGIVSIFEGIWDAMVAILKMPINALINLINGVIDGLNSIKIPEWVPGVGGMGINIPKIPQLAKGTESWKGGIVQVSERGGEIIDLPAGSRVYPHDESIKQAYNDGTRQAPRHNTTITIAKLADEIIVREDADIDRIAQAIADRLEKVSLNVGGGKISYSTQS